MSRAIVYESLVDKTYDEIKRMILSGELKAGERLRFKEMVERLEVSPTPIKLAFTRLEKEGFVVSIPHRGTMVCEFSQKDILEIFQIRESLETLAVSLAADCASVKDIALLRTINKLYKQAIDEKDMKKATEQDFYFHETLYKISENKRLHKLMNFSNVHLVSIAEKSNDFFGNGKIYYENHAAIIDAIEKHDAKEAQNNIQAHLTYAFHQILDAK